LKISESLVRKMEGGKEALARADKEHTISHHWGRLDANSRLSDSALPKEGSRAGVKSIHVIVPIMVYETTSEIHDAVGYGR
jgi:hypothetical protein